MKVRELINRLSVPEWMDVEIEVSMELYIDDNPYLRIFSKGIDICPQYGPDAAAVICDVPIPTSIALSCEHDGNNIALEGYEIELKKKGGAQ